MTAISILYLSSLFDYTYASLDDCGYKMNIVDFSFFLILEKEITFYICSLSLLCANYVLIIMCFGKKRILTKFFLIASLIFKWINFYICSNVIFLLNNRKLRIASQNLTPRFAFENRPP